MRADGRRRYCRILFCPCVGFAPLAAVLPTLLYAAYSMHMHTQRRTMELRIIKISAGPEINTSSADTAPRHSPSVQSRGRRKGPQNRLYVFLDQETWARCRFRLFGFGAVLISYLSILSSWWFVCCSTSCRF
ncbi:unnamed protein product [Ectocarpus sp. 13 AM-2016]